jgi:protease IV
MSNTQLPYPQVPTANPLKRLGGFLLWVVVPLALGIYLAYSLVPKPAVGIIRINSDIWFLTAHFVNMEIEEARKDPRIKAVIVQIDSPGGEVTATQEMYLGLQSLRREMPVVGSIDSVAASGGFFAALATDPVYAKPSSTIGNVGVWGYFPDDLGVNDVILASGPFKLTASNKQEFLREIESVKQEFLQTVVRQRGDRLKITTVDLSQGLAYHGREAMNLGLIDRLGSQSEAIEAAAKLAGLRKYDVIDLEVVVYEKMYGEGSYYAGLPAESREWVGRADPLTGKRTLPPGLYLLYDVRLGSVR